MPRYPRSPFKKVGASISPKVAGDALDEIIIGSTTPSAGDFTQIKTAKGIDIASANALTLGSDGNYFDITGTTAITSIDTLAIGTMVTLHFDGILTLTHHATDLILPSAANITTATGDEAIFIEYATGDWRCVAYTKASGESLILTTHAISHQNVGIDEISVIGLSGLLADDQHVLDSEVQAISINNVVEDTTPQLGGTLDTNSKQIRWSKGSDIASANALTLGSDGNYFDITGTTAITSIDTLAIGTMVTLHFDGILTLTHHATDLILPSAANITTAVGDEATFIEYAPGDWRCVVYTKASGEAVVGGGAVVASGTYTGDDNANRAIVHGLGTTPKLVMLIEESFGYSFRIIRSGYINYISDGSNLEASVTAADSTNFYVGNAGNLSRSANTTTINYHWVAIG